MLKWFAPEHSHFSEKKDGKYISQQWPLVTRVLRSISREEISRIRRAEAAKAAEVIGAAYHCLELEDVYILYDRDSINRTTALIRSIRPSVVFTASPNDYMVDHELTSMIVQTACFASGIKNMEVDTAPYEPVPYLYYCDPMEGKDIFGKAVMPSMYVDISRRNRSQGKNACPS